jgi:hypothetical protein
MKCLVSVGRFKPPTTRTKYYGIKHSRYVESKYSITCDYLRNSMNIVETRVIICFSWLRTPWPYSASELYRPRERRLSAKLVQPSADRECHVVNVTDPYGRILGFLDRTCCVNPIDNIHYAPTPATRTKYSHKKLH